MPGLRRSEIDEVMSDLDDELDLFDDDWSCDCDGCQEMWRLIRTWNVRENGEHVDRH